MQALLGLASRGGFGAHLLGGKSIRRIESKRLAAARTWLASEICLKVTREHLAEYLGGPAWKV